MTTPKPDDRAATTDPRVAAAWRAVSQESPPAALDAAILAAARREVGAGPQGSRTLDAMRARRQWWPLAAAATIAAIAVGLLQLTPPDRLGGPAPGTTAVTDMPVPTAGRPPERTATGPREEAASDSAAAERAIRGGTVAAPPPPAVVAREPRKDAARPLVAAPAPRPFPASPPDAAAPDTAAEKPIPALPNTGGLAAPEQRAPLPPPEAAASSASAERALAPGAAQNMAVPRQSPPAATLAPAPPGAAAGSAQPATDRAVAQRAAVAKTAAGAIAEDKTEARVKERAPLPVAEWIALIRRLRDEGKIADAARELAAFRAAHADHERLLPTDLRDWRPAEK